MIGMLRLLTSVILVRMMTLEVHFVEGIQYVLESKDITSYVIFDDDQDILYSQKDNFIHIDYMHGITKEHIEQAIKILNK